MDGSGLLTLYIVGPGAPDLFYLDEPHGQRITPSQLDTWLRELETAHPGVQINVIYEADYA
ncbi:MAG: hypothetical protein R2873_28795 [Caldilineaceae bacterium]